MRDFVRTRGSWAGLLFGNVTEVLPGLVQACTGSLGAPPPVRPA